MNAAVTLPRLVIEVDGALLPLEQAQTLSGIFVQQALSVPTQCELTFDQPWLPAQRCFPVPACASRWRANHAPYSRVK